MDNFKYARATNGSIGEYELLLHGIVGWEIEGPAIAREIKWLGDNGATKITLRINSVGGIINEGLSVVAAMISSKAEIHTFNEGTADSMALVILAAGDEGCRGTYDYGTGIIHDPLLGGVTLEKIENEKEKSFMQKMKDTLLTILENNTGKSRDELSSAMTEELMLNSSELKEFGIVDYVKTSKKQPKIKEGATVIERMAACSALIVDKNADMEFKSKYEAANAKLAEATAQIETLTAEIKAKDEQIVEKDTLIEDLKKENEEFWSDRKSAVVDRAIDSGVWEETDREFLENMAEKDLGAFEDMVDKIKEPQARATDFINRGGQEDDEDEESRDKWTWEDWEKKDPHGLGEMYYRNPDKYNKLQEEDSKKYAK